MKQLKELWTLVNNWLGNGKKCIIGLAFLLVSFVINWFSFFFYKGAHKEREGHLHVK